MNSGSETSPGCLHLVVGVGPDALNDCLAHSGAGDAVLFLDAGVQHLLHFGSGPLAGLAEAHFSAADLQAHGLFALARRTGVSVIDDAGFCALLQAHHHCLTWR